MTSFNVAEVEKAEQVCPRYLRSFFLRFRSFAVQENVLNLFPSGSIDGIGHKIILKIVLLSISSLLNEPNPDDPLV